MPLIIARSVFFKFVILAPSPLNRLTEAGKTLGYLFMTFHTFVDQILQILETTPKLPKKVFKKLKQFIFYLTILRSIIWHMYLTK